MSNALTFFLIIFVGKIFLLMNLITFRSQGMTVREFMELAKGGLKSYWTEAFNYADFIQLVLYWASVGAYWKSYVDVSRFVDVLCPHETFITLICMY